MLGLVINGLSTYAFLVIARRSVGEEAYGGLAVLWALVYILGPGLFQPLEQELARATAARGARGHGSEPVLRIAARVGGVGLGVVFLGLLVAWPLGLDGMLGDRLDLFIVLGTALAAFAVAELGRGILSGRHQYTEYGWYFAFEGSTRMLIAVVLTVVGVEAVGLYALTLPAAFAVAIAGAGTRVRPFVKPGPPARVEEITPALGGLLATSLSEAFLLNVGPVAVSIVGDDLGDHGPGLFLNGMIIARIPLFFFQAVKASLLPQLSERAASGDLDGFRDVLMRLLVAVMVLAGVSAVGNALLGPWLVDLLFGDELGARDMAMLSLSGGGLMVLLTLVLGLLALDHTRLAVAGFLSAVAMFPVAIQLSSDTLLRVELALVSAPVVGALVAGSLLRLVFAQHREAGRMSLKEPRR